MHTASEHLQDSIRPAGQYRVSTRAVHSAASHLSTAMHARARTLMRCMPPPGCSRLN